MDDETCFSGDELAFDDEEGESVSQAGASYPLPEPLASVLLAWAIGNSPAPFLDEDEFEPVARKVLVVEDDRSSRKALGRLFTLKGWEVTEAATLAEGFEGLVPPPRCIVLDLMLPDGDGADLLRHVRAVGLPSRVVVTTGISDKERLEAVVGLRPDSLIRKPIDFDALCRDCVG
jgi:CheY-like chemotaxis protein